MLYPPLFHLSALPFFFFFGSSFETTLLVNMVYFAILLFSCYFIARNFFGLTAGLASAMIISFFPGVFVLSRYFLLDFPLISMTALAFLSLIKTDSFSSRKNSIISGLIVGAGILVKLPLVIFIIGPFLVLALEGLKKHENRKNIFIFVLIAGGITGAWVLTAWPNLLADFFGIINFQSNVGIAETDPGINSVEAWLYYPLWIMAETGLILLIPSIYSLKKFFGKYRREAILLASGILIPLLLLTVFPNKDPRYIAPVLPLLAVFASCFFGIIEKKPIRNLAFVLLFFVGMSQFLVVSYAPFSKYSPFEGYCNAENIVDSAGMSAPITVKIFPESYYLNYATLLNIAYQKNSEVYFSTSDGYLLLTTASPEGYTEIDSCLVPRNMNYKLLKPNPGTSH
ncbi:MAG: glycosyltransferase family 39 protein [archaeon]|nr:glycosyltransferase family 39 protein [archaeon]